MEVFPGSLELHRAGQAKHLNIFIEQQAIVLWAETLGLTLSRIINGREPVIPIDEPVTYANVPAIDIALIPSDQKDGRVETNLASFGQSLAVLQKP